MKRKLANLLRLALSLGLLIYAVFGHLLPRSIRSAPADPLTTRCAELRRQIALREANVAHDERTAYQARVMAFRQKDRGAEARRLWERAEHAREENIHQINRLRGQLLEAELELRGAP